MTRYANMVSYLLFRVQCKKPRSITPLLLQNQLKFIIFYKRNCFQIKSILPTRCFLSSLPPKKLFMLHAQILSLPLLGHIGQISNQDVLTKFIRNFSLSSASFYRLLLVLFQAPKASIPPPPFFGRIFKGSFDLCSDRNLKGTPRNYHCQTSPYWKRWKYFSSEWLSHAFRRFFFLIDFAPFTWPTCCSILSITFVNQKCSHSSQCPALTFFVCFVPKAGTQLCELTLYYLFQMLVKK